MEQFDTTVDVLCIGTSPAAMVAAIATADAGLSVLAARLPHGQSPWRPDGIRAPRSWAVALRNAWSLEGLSADTMAYLHAVTAGLDRPESAPAPTGLELRHIGRPVTRTDRVAPFHGGEVTRWDRTCLNSPYGLLYSRISLPAAREVVDSTGARVEVNTIGPLPSESRVSPSAWLAAAADSRGVGVVAAGSLHRLVFEDGRVVGAVLGEQTIRVSEGVLLGAAATRSDDHDLRHAWATPDAQLGITSVVGSRFGRLELLTDAARPEREPGVTRRPMFLDNGGFR